MIFDKLDKVAIWWRNKIAIKVFKYFEPWLDGSRFICFAGVVILIGFLLSSAPIVFWARLRNLQNHPDVLAQNAQEAQDTQPPFFPPNRAARPVGVPTHNWRQEGF